MIRLVTDQHAFIMKTKVLNSLVSLHPDLFIFHMLSGGGKMEVDHNLSKRLKVCGQK